MYEIGADIKSRTIIDFLLVKNLLGRRPIKKIVAEIWLAIARIQKVRLNLILSLFANAKRINPMANDERMAAKSSA